jgi:hypothetical protein
VVVEATKGVGTVAHLGDILDQAACAPDEDLTIEVNLLATRIICKVGKA